MDTTGITDLPPCTTDATQRDTDLVADAER